MLMQHSRQCTALVRRRSRVQVPSLAPKTKVAKSLINKGIQRFFLFNFREHYPFQKMQQVSFWSFVGVNFSHKKDRKLQISTFGLKHPKTIKNCSRRCQQVSSFVKKHLSIQIKEWIKSCRNINICTIINIVFLFKRKCKCLESNFFTYITKIIINFFKMVIKLCTYTV